MSVEPAAPQRSVQTQSSSLRWPELPPFGRQLRDLLWFLRLTLGIAPRPSLWFGLATVASGLIIPLELWSTRGLVDSLAAHLGSPGSAVADASKSPWIWLAVVVSAMLLQRLLSGLTPYLRVRLEERAGPETRELAMRKASALALVAFENDAFYDNLNRVMSGAERRGPDMIRNVMRLIGSLLALGSYGFVLGVYAPVLLAITFTVILLVVLEFTFAGKINWDLLHEQTRERRLSDYYAGVLGNRRDAKEVRLYGLSEYMLERWSTLFWQTRNEQRRLAFKLGLRQRGMVLLATASSMLGLWWVVYAGMVRATPGEVALIFTSISGMWRLFDTVSSFKSLGTTAGYASEFRAFMQLPEELPPQPDRANGARPQSSANGTVALRTARPFPNPLKEGIRFHDVWFTYPNSDQPALAGATFEISAGEKVALVGENGAGKSTIVKLLLGLYRPERGRITFDGVDIDEIDPRSLRRAASAVFQQFAQYQLTLYENIGLAHPAQLDDRRRIEEAAVKAGVSEYASRLEHGYETLLGPDVGGTDLSGGQWQRVALARAFFRNAQILVLDEPTAALDPKAELAVFRRFVDLVRDRTAVLISHRLGMARLADRVIVLREGRVVESGPHDSLVSKNGEYAGLFAAQARWYQ